MGFSHRWFELPGPAGFCHTLIEDLTQGLAVVVGIPSDVPALVLSRHLAELVKRRNVARLVVATERKLARLHPRAFIDRSCRSGNYDGIVVLVDMRHNQDQERAWREFVVEITKTDIVMRICLVVNEKAIRDYSDEKHLRVRCWSKFVGLTDSRVLFEERSRAQDVSREYIALKGALIERIAGSNLSVAHQLSRQTLRDLLTNSNYSSSKIWSAEISVLFPLIDRERRRILEKYRRVWQLPYQSKTGNGRFHLYDLEVSDMVDQAENMRVLSREKACLKWLRRVRNLLAHMRVVRWETLVNVPAKRLFDFSD